jgi:hypothetical protein
MYLSLADFPNGLNLVLPSYDDISISMSKETKEKVSIRQKKRFENIEERIKTSISTKKGFTDEVKAKMSNIHKVRFEDEGLRKQRSEIRKAYYVNNPSAKIKASETAKNTYKNKPHLLEVSKNTFKKYRDENKDLIKQKIRQRYIDNPNIAAKIGIKNKQRFIDNPELRELAANKTREQLNKYGHPMSKKVVNIITGVVFNTVKDAAKEYGVCENTFRDYLKGRKQITIQYKYI